MNGDTGFWHISQGDGAARWFRLEWSASWRYLFAVLIALIALAQLVIGSFDLVRYASDFPSLASTLVWLGGAAVSGVAVVALAKDFAWWPLIVFVAELVILALASYVIWVDLRSPHRDGLLLLVAGLAIIQAVVPLASLLPRYAHLPARAWVAVLAAVSAFGVTQYLIETQVVPNRSFPSLDVTASLEEIGRTGDTSWVRGRVTWTNNGRVTASVLGALATVVASSETTMDSTLGFAVTDPYRVALAVDSAGADPVAGESSSESARYSDASFAMASSIDPIRYASGVYESELRPDDKHRIIWMEDLTIPQWFVLPGQSETREFTLHVDRTTAAQVELRVDAWFATNMRHSGWRTCAEHVALTDTAFMTTFRNEQSSDPNVCLWAALKPRNAVRSLADDAPYVWIEYSLDRDGYFGGLLAFLGSRESGADVASDEAEKIARTRPVAGSSVVAALPLSDKPLSG